MQLNEFKRLVRAGESSRVEFKSRDFHNDSLAKEIVAFANMKGGRIYIGVRDNGELEDIEQKIEERIVNICRNNILPSIIPDIETLLIDDRRILCIHIDRGRHKPYKVKKSNKFYIRAGSVSIEPSNEELVRLFQTASTFISKYPRSSPINVTSSTYCAFVITWKPIGV